MSDALIGTMIAGKYRIHRLLGTGGMGAVYAGEHLEIGKRVAIKVINQDHASSAEVAARFRREARAASAVESASIVHVFDVGTDPVAGLYMVMEYLDGEDLASRLEREKKISAEDVVAIGVQSCRALAKAHAAGVIHRDLKPANIYLTSREDDSLLVKILDFGISKLLNDGAPSVRPGALGEPVVKKALTRVGAAIGTPQYMSPEQAQGLELDQRSDVWSMGAVLYEALAGAPAYQELGTYEQTIIRIVMTPATPLASVAPWVPRALAEVIDAALVHDVAQRIPDCGTFARRLKASLGAEMERSSNSLQRPNSEMHVPRSVVGGGMSPLSSTLGLDSSQVDSLASTIASNSPLTGAAIEAAVAKATKGAPDFSRTLPIQGLGVNADPHAPRGTSSTGTAVMMPEEPSSIPGVGKGVSPFIVGAALLGIAVIGGGIFLVSRSGTSSTDHVATATSVVSAIPPPPSVDLPSKVTPLESIVPIAAASITPPDVKPVSPTLPVSPSQPPQPHGLVPPLVPAGGVLAAHPSSKPAVGTTSPPAVTSAAPATPPGAPPKKGQFGGAGVDDNY
jgi:serine/threonine-protein kinase